MPVSEHLRLEGLTFVFTFPAGQWWKHMFETHVTACARSLSFCTVRLKSAILAQTDMPSVGCSMSRPNNRGSLRSEGSARNCLQEEEQFSAESRVMGASARRVARSDHGSGSRGFKRVSAGPLQRHPPLAKPQCTLCR